MGRFNPVCMPLLAALLALSGGCAVVPYPNELYASPCPTTSQRQTLRMVNVLEESRTDGLGLWLASPVVVPVTAVVSGVYVAANNTYNAAEERLKCGG